MFEIRERRQLQLLVSPMRQAIIDVLEGTGECPVADLARILNRPPDTLYYHVNLLQKAGLLVAKRHPSLSGRAHRTYALRHRGTSLRYRPSDKINATVVARIVASMSRDALRSFKRAFVEEETVRGPRRTLWAGRRLGWLNRDQLTRLNAALNTAIGVLEEGSEQSRNTRLYSLTHVFSPYVRKSRSRTRR